jgi:predicted RNA polymerase sigma factor
MNEAASTESGATARDVAETVARRSYGKLVAYLAARTRNVAAAEDALADAFASALAQWPRSGSPLNPEAWLLTVARRKIIDSARHERSGDAVIAELHRLSDDFAGAPGDMAIPDHRLALLFTCAHPAIETSIRAPLMLQAVLGLDAKRIASAFLMSPATMGKRLVRAKDKIRNAGIAFRIPERDELAARLDSVLEAIYAAFADGWADPGGTDVARRDLTEEAIFLARLAAELLPDEAEALGVLACMLHAHARRRARRTATGDYVPLDEQDILLWDAPMISEAEAMLRRASTRCTLGRYQLEAALQSAHVERRSTGRDNWAVVLQLYDALSTINDSPVIAINRALAVAEVRGVDAALAAMPDVATDARLADYQPYWATRAELLARSGARRDAGHAYDIAIGLEHDDAVRRFLQERKAMSRPSRPATNPVRPGDDCETG